MSKDYTKYNVKGLGENLNKRKLVFTIVKDYVEKNNPKFEELQNTFPDELQGSNGVIKKESEVTDSKRFNMREPLKIKNGVHVVVSNQWGANIEDFINVAIKLGFAITKSNLVDIVVEPRIGVLKLENFNVGKMNAFLEASNDDDTLMDQIDEEIESLLDNDPKYYIISKLMDKLGFEYDHPEILEYFQFTDDEVELKDMLSEESLLSRVIKKEGLENKKITSKSDDFLLNFSGYFMVALELLVYCEDNEMLAEFIVSQSVSNIEDEYDVDSLSGDWIADLTEAIIHNVYGFDIQDYEGECEIDGYNFGTTMTMGYNYHAYAQEIIDSMI
ncbi:hypothetical protein N9P12_01060 [Bacteroidia bacterium]|nr:hypothetical protein [Bacteroidia bacterium]MDA9213752.1 hypothetical protein [Bacteroidia bacterium]